MHSLNNRSLSTQIHQLIQEITLLSEEGKFTSGVASEYVSRIEDLVYYQIMNRKKCAAFL